MSPEGVAFLVVLAAVGAIPGAAALLAHRAASRRVEARLAEILVILRGRSSRGAVGFALPAPKKPEGAS